MSEVMAKVAAQNIATDIKGDESLYKRIISGNTRYVYSGRLESGVAMLSDQILEPRNHEILFPGP